MIKGFAITPPVLGRISIGRVIEKNGKRLPEKDDQFTITSLVQVKGDWLLHPLDQKLRQDAQGGKLRSIPVTLPFNDPELNLRVEYSAFDKTTGRPMCVCNGETSKVVTRNGLETQSCGGLNTCQHQCKTYGRLNVKIGDDDDIGTFIFRTTGFNSIRTLAARLSYYQAISGNRLSCMPLELRIRGKSTTQSFRQAIFYVDLTLREGLTLQETIAQAIAMDAQRRGYGFNQEALDNAARQGFANGLFEDSEEEAQQVIKEFYPDEVANQHNATHANSTPVQQVSNLNDKLMERLGA